MLALQARQDGLEQAGGIVLGHAQAHLPHHRLAGETGEDAVMGLQQVGGLQQHAASERGQGYRLVVALEQPATSLLFQPADLAAHRRGAAIELQRGGTKLSQPHDGVKGAQDVDIEGCGHDAFLSNHSYR